jgi:hypothetical protein
MLKTKITDLYARSTQERVCQGDLLINLGFSISNTVNEKVEVNDVLLEYAVVMSQDCDLEQYFKNKNSRSETDSFDKYLPTILVCPAYPSERFIAGIHLAGKQMFDFDGTKNQPEALKRISQNDKFNRYHFLKGVKELFPDLVIDFKHFYTVPTDIIFNNLTQYYLITINELFRERLSQRFANYLSRFGLPEIK